VPSLTLSVVGALLLAVRLQVLHLAGLAVTPPLADVGVRLVIGVPLRAVRLTRVEVRAVSDAVQDVLTAGAIPEVRQSVVEAVAVAMQALHLRRAWPDESGEDQPVGQVRALDAVLGCEHKAVVARLGHRWLEDRVGQ
jgi:hypothetical protein